MRDGRLKQVEGAADVDVHKIPMRMARKVGLVERPSMDHAIEAVFGKEPIHERTISHAANDLGICTGRDVEAQRLVPFTAQHRR